MEEIEIIATFLNLGKSELVSCGGNQNLIRHIKNGVDTYYLCKIINDCKNIQELVKNIDDILNLEISQENLNFIEYSVKDYKKVKIIYFDDRNSVFDEEIAEIISKFKNKNFDIVYFIYKNPYLENLETIYELKKP